MVVPGDRKNETVSAESQQPPAVKPASWVRRTLGGVSRIGSVSERDSVRTRRRFVGFWLSGFLFTNFIMFLRYFFPRVLYEPNTKFKIGAISDFGIGVDTRFKNTHRIWVVRTGDELFVIFARCTHLGCTPNWMQAEQKFKCPCHGSGYDPEGINFEGPAPRPMDRAHISLDPEGQIEVDTSILYTWAKGQTDHFNDPGAFLAV